MSQLRVDIDKLSADNDKVNTSSFTKDQSRAFEQILEWLKRPFMNSDYKRALCGAAGTGKTYLLRAIITNSDYSYSTIGLSAPTHKAVRILQKSLYGLSCNFGTLQSDLGLRLNIENEAFDVSNPPFDPKGRIKVTDYNFYVVDEASMINKSLVALLEQICRDHQIKLLYCGDSFQLPPVNEFYSSAFRGAKIHRLTEIVRQDEDNPVKKLLDILRDDIKNSTYNFLSYISKYGYEADLGNTKGYVVCSSVGFNKAMISNFNDERFLKDIDLARVVAYTNVAVSKYNSLVRNILIKDAAKSVITKHDLLMSYVTIVNDFLSPIITNSEEYIIKDIVNYVHPKYKLKGFMVTFTSIHGGENTQPLFVLDFSDPKASAEYYKIHKRLLEQGHKYGAAGWRQYYEFHESVLMLTNVISRDGKILYRRDLDYGFALTAHRSQGSTFENVLVDVNDICFNSNGMPYTNANEVNRRLYVACSRCRNKLYLKFGNK